jgi:hypothetical protein
MPCLQGLFDGTEHCLQLLNPLAQEPMLGSQV